MPGTIKIVRPSALYAVARKLKVKINDVEVGSVNNNGTQEFSVSPGLHDVVVSMDWQRSKPLQVDVIDGTISTILVEMPSPLIVLWVSLFGLLGALLGPKEVFKLKLL